MCRCSRARAQILHVSLLARPVFLPLKFVNHRRERHRDADTSCRGLADTSRESESLGGMVVLHPLPLLQLRGGLIPTMSEGAIDSPITTAALFIGTFSSAISGCISAGTKEMDLIGCIVVALVTALGGGTMRDILLGRAVYWRYAPNRIHLHIAIYTSAFTFLVWPEIVARGFKDTHLAFLWSDALAMAASTVIGTHIGLKVRRLHAPRTSRRRLGRPRLALTPLPAAPDSPQATNNWLIGVLSGLCTATFGGIGRDLLCQARPSSPSRLAGPGLALSPATQRMHSPADPPPAPPEGRPRRRRWLANTLLT